MSAQNNIEILSNDRIAPPYCSDPDCDYCKKLREMQEQISGARSRCP